MDALCNAFGALLGEVFACRDDIWAPALRGMGNGLGAFIYLMAPTTIWKRTAAAGSSRPAAAGGRAAPAAYEQRCHELLTQQMGRCAQQFEMLADFKGHPGGEAIVQHDLFRRVEQIRAGTQAQGGKAP